MLFLSLIVWISAWFGPIDGFNDLVDSRYPHVRLSDAREFGVRAQECRLNCQTSACHAKLCEKDRNNWFDDLFAWCAWRQDAVKCYECWNCLDNVLWTTHNNCALGCQCFTLYRLGQLDKLRLLLGDEKYAARQMPELVAGQWHLKID